MIVESAVVTTINKKKNAINGVYLNNQRTHQLDTRQVFLSDNEYHTSIDKIAQSIDTFTKSYNFV